MSFYRTLLEDDVNYLDDNNDGSEMAKELMEEIDNAEENIEEVEDAQAAEFSPDGSDIVDEMYMAIAESEFEWNAMMEEVGMRELNEAHRGVVTESLDSVKDFFVKCKDKIKEFFKKVWDVIKRWASNVFSMMHTNKKFVQKYESKINDGYAIYAKDKKIDRIEGYKFTNLESSFNKFVKATNIVKPADESANVKALENIRKNYAGGKTDSSSFRDNVIEHLRGGAKKEKLAWTSKTVCDILRDENVTKKKLNEAMKESKKQFKDAIKEIDNLQADAISAAKDDPDNKKAKKDVAKYTVMATGVREQLKLLQVIRSCMLSCIGARIRQARKIGNLYVHLANKDTYKGFKENSYGFLSGMSLI